MPPRLMPARYDFVDTAAEYFNFGPQVKVEFGADGQPNESALAQYGNPYAAMPSFHVGWSTWCRARAVAAPATALGAASARRLPARRDLLHHRDRQPLAARRRRRVADRGLGYAGAVGIDRSARGVRDARLRARRASAVVGAG